MIDPGLTMIARRLTLIATNRERGAPNVCAPESLTHLSTSPTLMPKNCRASSPSLGPLNAHACWGGDHGRPIDTWAQPGSAGP
jgi:hypothetical protein